MTNTPPSSHNIPATPDTAPKLPWHAPSLGEVDYADTRNSVNPAFTYDGVSYTS